MRAWGPYRSDYRLLEDALAMGDDMPPLVLIGTGAGCPFILDFHEYVVSKKITLRKPVKVYFSCRSIGLFQYVTNMTCKNHMHNWHVNAHLTSHDNIEYTPSDGKKTREGGIGRRSFAQILENAEEGTHVYFCGSPALQERVAGLSELHGLTFHLGHAFSS